MYNCKKKRLNFIVLLSTVLLCSFKSSYSSELDDAPPHVAATAGGVAAGTVEGDLNLGGQNQRVVINGTRVPKTPAEYYHEGLDYFNEVPPNYHKASPCFLHAVGVVELHMKVNAYIKLAVCSREQNNFPEAFYYYKNALDLDNQNDTARRGLITLHCKNAENAGGDTKYLVKELKKAQLLGNEMCYKDVNDILMLNKIQEKLKPFNYYNLWNIQKYSIYSVKYILAVAVSVALYNYNKYTSTISTKLSHFDALLSQKEYEKAFENYTETFQMYNQDDYTPFGYNIYRKYAFWDQTPYNLSDFINTKTFTYYKNISSNYSDVYSLTQAYFPISPERAVSWKKNVFSRVNDKIKSLGGKKCILEKTLENSTNEEELSLINFIKLLPSEEQSQFDSLFSSCNVTDSDVVVKSTNESLPDKEDLVNAPAILPEKTLELFENSTQTPCENNSNTTPAATTDTGTVELYSQELYRSLNNNDYINAYNLAKNYSYIINISGTNISSASEWKIEIFDKVAADVTLYNEQACGFDGKRILSSSETERFTELTQFIDYLPQEDKSYFHSLPSLECTPEEDPYGTSLYSKGFNYEDGLEGMEKNFEKAFGCYKQAADHKGNSDAQYALGRMYEKGIGCNTNLNEAKRYYKLAADQKNENARRRLYALYK